MPTQRPEGVITRGTTNPGRLGRLDRWWQPRAALALRSADRPLVIDLGYGASAVTTWQWYRRLVLECPAVRVVGLEIDPARVAEARRVAFSGLELRRGGFELAGLRPVLVRAANVLRQYHESEVAAAWERMCAGLAPGGLIVEGTCDELGRLGGWILLDSAGPRSLTLIADLTRLDCPSTLAQRLPKALVHHNLLGQPVGDLMRDADEQWRRAADWQIFGPRDRWRRMLDALARRGWPIAESPARRRDGTLTVPWSNVSAG